LKNKKLLAAIIARNEWPLLGLAIAHALQNGADEVLVVDHDSNDETLRGIAQLQTEFPDQIFLALNHDANFRQAASMHLALANFGIDEFDWIYFFDADEFMIFDEGEDLKTLVEQVPERVLALRYAIENWLVPHQFRDDNIDQYMQINQRAQVNKEFSELSQHHIKSCVSNYFDYPFLSKLIVRVAVASRLTAGSHRLVSHYGEEQMEMEVDKVRVAHLPFVSYDKLLKRVEMAARERRAGFDKSHGWSQMISDLHHQGNLEEFWSRHSISNATRQKRPGHPSFDYSEDFSTSIAKAVKTLKKVMTVKPLPPKVKFELNEPTISAVNNLLLERENLLNERENLAKVSFQRRFVMMIKLLRLIK